MQNDSTISLDYSGLIGRRTGLTDQAGAETGFVYDARSLLLTRTDPLGRSAGYAYDDAGRRISATDRNQDTIGYAYTPFGKLDSISYPGGGSVQFGYGINEEILSMTDSLGTTSYGYDPAGRLVAQTDPHGFTVGYGYDAAGNLTSITYPGDKTVTYGYDALNRLTRVTDWRGGVTQYFYDAAGRLMLQINPNGSYTNFGYDSAGRLTSQVNRRGNGTIIASQFFTLDANGNRVEERRRAPQVPWSLATETVAMDFNATRNRLLEAGSDSFAYDDEGQLIDRAGTTLSFDPEHRLTAIGPDTTFAYDGVGNRLRATRDGQVTRYIYDQAGNLLAEADQSNQITRYYVHGLGLIGLIEGQDAYQYHFDALGSTVALTDTGGEIVNAYTYAPYGRVVNKQETIPQPFQYVGQYGVMAEPAGLYYMRARYYDPEVGRFISEDPIGFEGGLNLYAYVGGNPVNYSDPSGLFCVPCVTFAGQIAVQGARTAAPIIARGAVSGFNSIRAAILSSPATTGALTAASNPQYVQSAIDVAGFSASQLTNTPGPPSSTPLGYALGSIEAIPAAVISFSGSGGGSTSASFITSGIGSPSSMNPNLVPSAGVGVGFGGK